MIPFRPYDNPQPTADERVKEIGGGLQDLGQTIVQNRLQQQQVQRQQLLDSYLQKENARKQFEWDRQYKTTPDTGFQPYEGGANPGPYQPRALFNDPNAKFNLIEEWNTKMGPPPGMSRADYRDNLEMDKLAAESEKARRSPAPVNYVIPQYDPTTGLPSGGFTPLPTGARPAPYAPRPPAPKAGVNTDEGKASVSDLLSTLRGHYQTLSDRGQAVDVNADTMSNMKNSIAASPIGQGAGRLFGTERQSTLNAIEGVRPLLINAIRKATGMSAKAMDSNAELNFYLQAATKPGNDIQANLKAIETLDRQYGLGLGTDGDVMKRTIRNKITGETKEQTSSDGGKTWQ